MAYFIYFLKLESGNYIYIELSKNWNRTAADTKLLLDDQAPDPVSKGKSDHPVICITIHSLATCEGRN